MTLPVKWFHSDMQAAPSLTSAPGSLIALLDACLINGFNLLTLDSLTYDSVSGDVTATIASGHGFIKHQVILIAGATQTEYNGEQRVTWVDSTTFRYTPTAAPTATPATGTCTAKAAPVGSWQKAYDNGAGTKAAYQSLAPTAFGCLLRVDDTNTVAGWNANGANTEVFGVESMTDIDTFTGAFYAPDGPTGSKWCMKDDQSNGSDACGWDCVADGAMMYIIVHPNNQPYGASVLVFGDIISSRPGEGYGTILIAGQNKNPIDYGNQSFGRMNDSRNKQIARAYSQFPGSVPFFMSGNQFSTTLGATGIPFPNATDNGLYLQRSLFVVEGSTVRGVVPGLIQCLHALPLPSRAIVEGIEGDPTALIWATMCSCGFETYRETSQPMFDLRGPWLA